MVRHTSLLFLAALLLSGCSAETPAPYKKDSGWVKVPDFGPTPDRGGRPDRSLFDGPRPDRALSDAPRPGPDLRPPDGPRGDLASQFFGDVPPGHWANPYVTALYRKNALAGCSTNPPQFCPNQLATRAEAATLVVKLLHGDTFSYPGVPYFSDVPDTHWAFKYVQKLKQTGLTAETGTFRPGDSITRAELATLVIRGSDGNSFSYPQTPYFGDVPASHWSFKYVQRLKQRQICSDTGTFSPGGTVKRDLFAVWTARAMLNMP